MSRDTLVMGAVAYAPKVVTIWEGLKAYLAQHNMKYDFVLYTNYERQVQDLFSGYIDVAWNSPLAYVRARRFAASRGLSIRPLIMRDTDCDLHSVFVVNAESPIQTLQELRGKTLGTGALDSPQATLIPLDHLRQLGLTEEKDYTVCRFDVLTGKHGDHIGGERDAVLALLADAVDVCCLNEGNYNNFMLDGTMRAGTTRIIGRTGAFDHCNFTAGPHAPPELVQQFTELVLAMRWENPQIRPLLELEGLREWLPARSTGYDLLERAVGEQGFYAEDGSILHPDYDYD